MTRKKHNKIILGSQELDDSEPQLCNSGSIEQHLDMCENGTLRGDEIDRRTANRKTPIDDDISGDPLELDREFGTFELDMAERDREGDDMSGDEHSSGLQGEDFETSSPPSFKSGTPGSYGRWEESVERKILEIERKIFEESESD